MKTTVLTALCSTLLATGLPARAQTSALPGSPPLTPAVSQEAKEKAEDATLLEQLDSEPTPRTPGKPRNRGGGGNSVFFGGGGAMGGADVMTVPFGAQNLVGRAARHSWPLVVRTSNPDPKAQADLEEDLNIMSRLLAKALEELPGGPGNGNKVMGIDVFFGPVAAPLRSLYLDNYGAVFFLNVNFPLIAPPEKPAAEKKPTDDSAWEEARQELYGQPQGGLPGLPGEDFSQEKVEKLKDALCDALKNASNIRGLAPTEFVTLWVSGGTSGGPGRMRRFKANPPGTLGGNFMAAEPALPARRTILTLQATKAEIDQYAAGKLTAEQFQKKIRITSYPGDAAGTPAPAVLGFGARTGF